MKICHGVPPNYDEIKAKFDFKGKSPIFCWGDTIYYPDGTELPEHLIVHESVHCQQQLAFPGKIEAWWKQYLADDQFRLDQEVPAYQLQYKFVKATHGRQVSRDFLQSIAKDLSSAMYGNLIKKATAIKLIENA